MISVLLREKRDNMCEHADSDVWVFMDKLVCFQTDYFVIR